MKQKDMKRTKTVVDYGSKMTMQELVCDGLVANTEPMMRVTGTTVIDGKKYKTLAAVRALSYTPLILILTQ